MIRRLSICIFFPVSCVFAGLVYAQLDANQQIIQYYDSEKGVYVEETLAEYDKKNNFARKSSEVFYSVATDGSLIKDQEIVINLVDNSREKTQEKTTLTVSNTGTVSAAESEPSTKSLNFVSRLFNPFKRKEYKETPAVEVDSADSSLKEEAIVSGQDVEEKVINQAEVELDNTQQLLQQTTRELEKEKQENNKLLQMQLDQQKTLKKLEQEQQQQSKAILALTEEQKNKSITSAQTDVKQQDIVEVEIDSEVEDESESSGVFGFFKRIISPASDNNVESSEETVVDNLKNKPVENIKINSEERVALVVENDSVNEVQDVASVSYDQVAAINETPSNAENSDLNDVKIEAKEIDLNEIVVAESTNSSPSPVTEELLVVERDSRDIAAGSNTTFNNEKSAVNTSGFLSEEQVIKENIVNVGVIGPDNDNINVVDENTIYEYKEVPLNSIKEVEPKSSAVTVLPQPVTKLELVEEVSSQKPQLVKEVKEELIVDNVEEESNEQEYLLSGPVGYIKSIFSSSSSASEVSSEQVEEITQATVTEKIVVAEVQDKRVDAAPVNYNKQEIVPIEAPEVSSDFVVETELEPTSNTSPVETVYEYSSNEQVVDDVIIVPVGESQTSLPAAPSNASEVPVYRDSANAAQANYVEPVKYVHPRETVAPSKRYVVESMDGLISTLKVGDTVNLNTTTPSGGFILTRLKIEDKYFSALGGTCLLAENIDQKTKSRYCEKNNEVMIFGK